MLLNESREEIQEEVAFWEDLTISNARHGLEFMNPKGKYTLREADLVLDMILGGERSIDQVLKLRRRLQQCEQAA